ncbi:MAG: tetratricopeptide repeat protein [Chloroflexota bacterium]
MVLARDESSGRRQNAGAAATRRHNLPARITSFIGREQEIADLCRLLTESRLVTLTGPGGVGKTRLAQRIAASMVDTLPDGAWQVELAALTDPDSVVRAIAATLGLREESARTLADLLGATLAARSLLLVIDNCEHMLGPVAALAERLLTGSPGLRVLATSRQALGITGEVSWAMTGLTVPEIDRNLPLEQLESYSAIRLFLERARAAVPGFALSESTASAVADICRHLDGVPLAIELAAARVKTLSPAQIATRLDHRFQLLTGGSRTALPRLQTLRGAIDWSYDLLDERERLVLQRLSVFHGGWTLDAAEAVCAGGAVCSAGVLDLLSGLVDKSLVLVEQDGDVARYRFLETIREYARERLAESLESDAVWARLVAWCVALAEEAEPKLVGPEQDAWLVRIEREHDNIRAALWWSLSRGTPGTSPDSEMKLGDATSWRHEGIRLAASMMRFWSVRGHLTEGCHWLETALALNPETSIRRLRALNATALLAWPQGDYARIESLCREALALARELADPWAETQSLSTLGIVLREEADYAQATAVLEEALAVARRIGDRGHAAMLLDNMGSVAWRRGEYSAAAAFCEESLSIFRDVGDTRNVAMVLEDLAIIAFRLGNIERAAALLTDSLGLLREVGDRRRLSLVFGYAGSIAAARHDWTHAAILCGAAEALRAAIGAVLPAANRPDFDQAVVDARRSLGDQSFDEMWSQGASLTSDQAIQEALGVVSVSTPPGGPVGQMSREPELVGGRDQDAWQPLTRREHEVATLVARGLMNREIGSDLVIGERTVETHIAHIFAKLGISSRAQVATWLAQRDLLGDAPTQASQRGALD